MKLTELDEILANLDAARQRKEDLAIAMAKREIETINRETVAYYDGAYDAIKEIRKRLSEEGET